ncbi:MAG: DUF5320 domain-containing protein [Deltaproteobacteria bacterium]|nr:DUF5320 domain-containing protein [Deltaproteobacteria bacterium]
MPGFDRTGPLGQGPMTGRGLGRCGPVGTRAGAGYGYGWWPGYGWGGGFGRGPGRGFGRGFGRGMGRGFGFRGCGWSPFYGGPVAATGPEEEKSMLQAEADELKSYLADLESRLAELKAESDQE